MRRLSIRRGAPILVLVVRRLALLASLLAPACVPAAAPATRSATPRESPPCTQARLAAFDPHSAVVERGPLPPMEQATEAHTEELITLPCEDGDAEEACLERAEVQVMDAYPEGQVTEAGIGVDREVVRAELRVDDRDEVITAESLVALAEVITKRREKGEAVVVVQAERIPAPDAARAAVVRVRLPGRLRAREALRAYLVLSAPVSPVRTLLALQVRAAEERLLLRAVEPQPDGTIRVELGCERPVDPQGEEPPGSSAQDDGGTASGS